MRTKDILTSTDPVPGALLEAYREAMGRNDVASLRDRVETDGEQRRVANDRLRYYLGNLADSPGARHVVERFYEERYDETVDPGDEAWLRSAVPDVESVLRDRALPVVSKADLRSHFGVDGVRDEDGSSDRPTLTPRWVIEHDDEPYRRIESSGTTGRPWGRAMTRNDYALYAIQYTTFLDDLLREHGLDAEETSVAVALWGAVGEAASESMERLGADVHQVDFEALTAGGDPTTAEAERLISHVGEGDHGVVIGPVQLLMKGAVGVAIRRGDVDLDLTVNGGQVLTDEHREILQSCGSSVEDWYGESECPQNGGRWIEVDGNHGFELAFDAQLFQVYDAEADELRDEGRGRLAYLPFGLEGIAIPGVYVSGIEAELTRVGDEHQLLHDVRRIEASENRCYEG